MTKLPKPISRQFTIQSVRLYCKSCHVLFYDFIPGKLIYAEEKHYILLDDSAKMLYNLKKCPICKGIDLWIWELL
jgi:hypothetical protein